MKIFTALVLMAVLFFVGCGGGGGDDESVEPPTNSTTAVNDNDECPVTITSAESAEDAVEQAEEKTGGDALSVNETTGESPGLDQGGALRVFKVMVKKDISIDVTGCDNTITIHDSGNTSDDDTEVNVSASQQ